MEACKGFLLVVDDEELNRDMLSRRLTVEGFRVLTASSGVEALCMLNEHDFDAILLDAMMPTMSGYQVLEEIRKTRSPLGLPVLMVTAKNQNEDVVNAFECGANDYIAKPINFPIAIARINCHVSGKRLSNQLRESEMRYSLSAQGVNDGLWDWDLTSDRIHFSTRWKTMLGYSVEEIGDEPREWFDRIHPDDRPHVHKALTEHRAGGMPQFESEHRMLHCDQSYRWVLTRGMAVRDGDGRETRMAGSQTDITRGKAADPLTGLPNRVLFMDHLDAAVKAARENGGAYYAVLFLDLDRFKIINDSLGHMAGDELLVAIAKRLESCVRGNDLVLRMHDRCTISRFGGDEFVVLCKGLLDPNHVTVLADRILGVLTQPLLLQGHEVSVSASIGIAIGVDGIDSADELLRDADTAMYQAKTQGKARWCVFDQTMRTQAVERLALETDLKRGIERGEFLIHYQPIVEMPSSRLKGFEALLRWKHPTRGIVSPLDFIHIAEETGFIIELGTWVLEEACRRIVYWQRSHSTHCDLAISVNVSTKQFTDPRFIERVQECLRKTGLDGRLLQLEITESAIMTDTLVAAQRLEQLRDLGIRISLDDFGTGYSSLSYLQSFKIDTLKIDRSFISRMGVSAESDEIVRTIVNLAHNLGMQVTAEGIEEQTQHVRLSSMACENGQGYHYSRPMPVEGVEEMLRKSASESEFLPNLALPIETTSFSNTMSCSLVPA
jgi:diguanylate cyclase (GGDEF)-like protein/PAS domain S-box-containing protein